MNKKVILFWTIFIGLALYRISNSFSQSVPDIGVCLKQIVVGEGTIAEDPTITDAGQVLVVDVNRLQLSLTANMKEQNIGINNTNKIGSTLNNQNNETNKTHGDKSCPSDLSIRLKTKTYPRFHFGETILFTGKLSQPFNFKSNTGRSFDYKGYLAKSDIYYEIKSAIVKPNTNSQISTNTTHPDDLGTDNIARNFDIDAVAVPFAGNANNTSNFSDSLLNKLNHLNNKLTEILYKIKRGFVNNLNVTLGEPHSALASGLVVGEKSALGKDLLNDFRTVGLIHIVVLSGFNITIVADALRRILSRLPRIWGIVIGGVGMVLFCILVGGGSTVIRSCFMASIALLAGMIRRDYHVARALLFAGLLMLIQNPLILLHDPSFQLSFLATLGLILLASPMQKILWFIPEKFDMRGICSATISTQIFVAPFILYLMGNLSLVGVFANILVLPFIPVTMLVVFLTGSLGFISYPVSQFFGWVSHLLLSYELLIVQKFAKIPFASLTFPQFSVWWVVGFYVAFGVGYAVVMYRSRKVDEDVVHSKLNKL